MTKAESPAGRVTRVAAYALVEDETRRVLLVRIAAGYPSAGQWTLPGGGLDFGEDPAVGALRELTEETGLVGEITRLAFVDSFSRPGLPEEGVAAWHAIRIVYLVELTGGSLRDETEESTDRADWFSPAETGSIDLVPLAVKAIAHLQAE